MKIDSVYRIYCSLCNIYITLDVDYSECPDIDGCLAIEGWIVAYEKGAGPVRKFAFCRSCSQKLKS